jgi:hypothetical protein
MRLSTPEAVMARHNKKGETNKRQCLMLVSPVASKRQGTAGSDAPC